MSRARLVVALVVAFAAGPGCQIEPDAPPPPAQDSARVAPAPDDVPAADVPRGAEPADAPRLDVAPADLTIPVVGLTPADLVDTFDDARSEGRVHDAIDILAPRGTPVVAAAPGVVARLFESEKGGRTVYVLGADRRTVYYYAHLDGYAPGLADGQTVRRGQAIGTVGSTGNASPEAPHLHFAIWTAPSAEAFWDGVPLNPYPLLGGQ